MNKKKMWGRWAKFFFFPLFLLNFNFNNANDPPRAGSIQTAFRNYYLRRQKTYIPTIVRAAVTVQRQCRVFLKIRAVLRALVKCQALARRRQALLKYRSLRAALVILQSYARMHSLHKQFNFGVWGPAKKPTTIAKEWKYMKKNAATKIQRAARGMFHRKRCNAATKIRANWVSWKYRWLYVFQRIAATTLQANLRCWRSRQLYLSYKAATKLQANLRCWRSRQLYLFKRASTTKIRANWLCCVSRWDYTFKRAMATRVQKNWRRWKSEKMHAASVKIQANWLCWKCRWLFIFQRMAAAKLQANVRCWRSRQLYLIKRASATKLQATWLCCSSRWDYTFKRAMATKVEASVRCWLAKKRFKVLLAAHKARAATIIQKVSRGFRARQFVALIRKYISKRKKVREEAAINFQRIVRGWICRESLAIDSFAASLIQSIVKMRLQRRKYKHTLKCIVKIQANWRMHREYEHFHFADAMATKITKVTRGFLARMKYVDGICAGIIQRLWRGYAVRRNAFGYNLYTIVIQRQMRMLVKRKAYRHKIAKVALLQSVARRFLVHCRMKRRLARLRNFYARRSYNRGRIGRKGSK